MVGKLGRGRRLSLSIDDVLLLTSQTKLFCSEGGKTELCWEKSLSAAVWWE